MNYKSYFKFSELINFGDDADTDQVAVEEEAMRNTSQAFNANTSANANAMANANISVRNDNASVGKSFNGQVQQLDEGNLEVMSAHAYNSLHKKDLY